MRRSQSIYAFKGSSDAKNHYLQARILNTSGRDNNKGSERERERDYQKETILER